MGNKSTKSQKSVMEKLDAKPLDLIMFSGGGALGTIVKTLEFAELGKGKWTHVGLVVTDELMPHKGLVRGRLYMLESVLAFSVPDIEGQRHKYGPQIRNLEDVIRSEYRTGEVSLYKVRDNPFRTKEDVSDVIEIFEKVFEEVSGKQYDIVGPFPGLFPCCRTFEKVPIVKRYIDERYYCSELATYVYQQVGIVSKDINPEYVVPEDFVGGDKEGMKIEFIGTPVKIK